MPFVTEMIEDAPLNHGNSQINSNVDPTSTLYILFALLIAFIFRGFILVFSIFLIKISLLGIFALFTYKMIVS